MASIFGKNPSHQPVLPPFAPERIAKEVAHLKKKQSVRHGVDERRTLGLFVTSVFVLTLLGLYAMDPFLYAWYKGNAIRAYLYLHNYDGDRKAQALAATGVFTEDDLENLNGRHGSYQDYYPSLDAAGKDADTVIAYMDGLTRLRDGPYDQLSPLDKVRYTLFCRWGIMPPMEWDALNPNVDSDSESN